jgi:U3 small nucleolar RNA-associated protein 3
LDGDDYPSDEDGDEDEVFGLQGLSEDDEDIDGDQEEDDVDAQDLGRAEGHPVKKKASSRAGAERKPKQSDSEEETWGRSKTAYYSSNAAEIESDEEANQLEEQEARRLQRKARDAMIDADFGFEDVIDVEEDKEPPE